MSVSLDQIIQYNAATEQNFRVVPDTHIYSKETYVPETIVPVPDTRIYSKETYVSETIAPDTLTFSLPDYVSDRLFGALIILLAIIGLMGNIVSFCYFWKRRHKTIYDFLYTTASKLDAVISIASLPVASSLLYSRTPYIFSSPVVCKSWPLVWETLHRISVLSVILISVFRTVSIVSPIKIRIRKMTTGIILVSIAVITLTAQTLILTLSSQLRVEYVKYLSHCSIILVSLRVQGENTRKFSWNTKLYSIIVQSEWITRCLVVFVSFLVSSISLRKKKVMQNDDERRFRRASITIALFTALFLVTTLPSFMLQVTYFISMFHSFTVTRNFRRYAHLVSNVILPLFNSAANPWLYLWRMPQYRAWLRNMVKGLLEGRLTLTCNRKDRVGRRRARVSFNFRLTSLFRRFNSRPTFSVSWRGEGEGDLDGRVQIGEEEPP